MPANDPHFIMVHHSLTADGATVSWAAIERYHRETQKWADIGYHAGLERVEADPQSPEAFQALIGRREDWTAAACKEGEMNRLALHVCVVGNFDLEAPSEALLARLCSRILRPWMHRYRLPASSIVGHRDYAHYKTCPGKLFDLDALRRRLA